MQDVKKTRTILLHVPNYMLDDLNAISAELGLARAELIRRCLKRDLAFLKHHEMPHIRRQQQLMADHYNDQAKCIID